MQTSSRLNLVTGEITDHIQAGDHRRDVEKGIPGASDPRNFVFYIPVEGDKDAGEPMEFVPGTNNTSHFRRAAKHGLDNYWKVRLQNAVRKPFVDGPKKLIILDNIFAYKGRDLNFAERLDFRKLPEGSSLWPLRTWVLGNKGQFTAAATHSVRDIVREIKDTRTMFVGTRKSLKDHFFIAHAGVVTDIDHFIYDFRPQSRYIPNLNRTGRLVIAQEREAIGALCAKTAGLYTDLYAGQIGLPIRNEEKPGVSTPNHIVGMPILMRLHANPKTIAQKGSKGLKCNSFDSDDQHHTVVTLNTHPDAYRESVVFKAVEKHLLEGKDVWVAASPTIEFDKARSLVEAPTEGHLKWGALNLVVSHKEQFMPAAPQPPLPASLRR